MNYVQFRALPIPVAFDFAFVSLFSYAEKKKEREWDIKIRWDQPVQLIKYRNYATNSRGKLFYNNRPSREISNARRNEVSEARNNMYRFNVQ